MRTSRIFTNSELAILERRFKGDKRDPNGTYSARVKPKLKELREFFKTNYTKMLLLLEDERR